MVFKKALYEVSYNVHPHLSARGLNLVPNFQKKGGVGGVTGPPFLEGGSLEKRGDIFKGRLQFLHKK